ncbi:MAG TPA: lytic transglycosylase [Spirochaetaceae bacterium]|jgi:soluble lytic murein transglycosylase-like protein|nr:lytic transglycosylase [Spirochaetaceae bacterium]
MFAVTLKNNGSYSDPVSRLYINDKTKNQVLKFFSAITNSMPVAKAILDNSIAHNVRPSLAFAVAYVESRYNPKARSVNTSGSLNSGLFQLNSSVFDKISEKQVFDPYHNARIGISHLKEYLILSEDEFTALAAYNAGITRIAEQGIPGVTFKYISEVSIMERKIMDLFVASMALSGNPL